MSSSLPFGGRHTPDSNSLDYKKGRQSCLHKPNPLNRTKTIGIKVNEAAYESLRWVAEGQGKPLGEWCRDRVMEATAPPGPRPTDFTLMAELTATQAILIDFLCVMGGTAGVSARRGPRKSSLRPTSTSTGRPWNSSNLATPGPPNST